MKLSKISLMRSYNLIFLFVMTTASFSSYAIEPQPIELGAFDLIPTIGVDLSHTDNMFLQ